MQTILVTGGVGYIGSHTVVELLNKGFHVIIIDNLSNSRKEILNQINLITGKFPEFYELDLLNYNALNSIFTTHEIHAVIHFAAFKSVGESMVLPLKYYENNIGNLTNILKTMLENKVYNFVFSSSCTVYGQPQQLPVTENTPIQNADSVYGTTKIMAETIIKDIAKAYPQINTMLLRYFNPAGAHLSGLIGEWTIDEPKYLFPYITQTYAGIRDYLKVFGNNYNTPDGTAIRDYIHVVDLAKAHVNATQRLLNNLAENNCEVYNIGTGKGYSVLEIINAFETETQKPLNYKIVDRRPGDIEQIYADCKLANTKLKWQTELTLQDIVSSALKWENYLNENFKE